MRDGEGQKQIVTQKRDSSAAENFRKKICRRIRHELDRAMAERRTKRIAGIKGGEAPCAGCKVLA